MSTVRSASVGLLFLVTAVLLAANALVLSSVREVTVIVDGEAVTITTFRSTVGEVLDQLGVEVEGEDFVSADPSEAVDDGATVEVVNAQTVHVTIDGSEHTMRAPVLTVGDVVEQLELEIASSELWLSHPVSAAFVGQTVVIRLPRDITVAVDGDVLEVTTNVLTVADALTEIGIELGANDIIEPALDTPLLDGASIAISRVTSDTLTVDESIPFETVNRDTDELFVGDSRVVQSGSEGVKRFKYRITRTDGEETDRELVKTTVVTEPSPRIVEHGTKEYPAGVDGMEEGLASYYGCGDGFDGQTTASGETFDDTAMTAAHPSLPFDTIVTVESHKTGRSLQVRINDRGPAAWTGKIIDLSCGAMKELAGVADGSHPVTITW